METTETISLKEMTKKELETLLQKKIFQLGMNGLQQNDLLKIIDLVEKELARRKEGNISQVNTQKETLNEEKTETTSEDGK